MQTLVDEILEMGYAVMPGLIPPTQLRELQCNIDRLLGGDREPMRPTPFSGFRTVRYFNLLNEGAVWERAATNPTILSTARSILGLDCLLSLMCTALINPQASQQELHCDDDIYDLPRPHPHLVLNTIWALTDF